MGEIMEHFGESTVHILEVDGIKWVRASDCAKALDYKNYREAASSFILINNELLNGCVRQIRTQSRGDRQLRDQWYFNEKGLIAFLIKTNQPKALQFQKWALSILSNEVSKIVKQKEYNSELRNKSKKIRVEFTDVLKEHGYTKPCEYIQTTFFMKTKLGIDKNRPKNDMDAWELCKISMAETLSTFRIGESEQQGYHNLKPVIGEATETVALIQITGDTP